MSRPDRDAHHEVESLLAAHERRSALDALVDEVMAPPGPPGGPTPPGPAPVAGVPMAPALHARYRIVERLGGGGMGVVYRAYDERLGREVALKFLPPHLSADPAAKRRLLVEARAAAALEHPNICTIHEIGDTDDGQLYLVMACYDGETLERLIARGPLPVDDALRIAGEVARGLAQAHERGIVHRDIKPANVVVTGEGSVKILDFDIAKLASLHLTQTGGAVGTLAYMSPEQAFGEAVDHRTDIWALGVVLYEMLTGVRPFRGTGEQALLVATLSADPEPVTTLRADAPAAVDAVIARALAKASTARFTSATEMLAALASCRTGAPGGAGVATVVGQRAPPAGTRRSGTLSRSGERRQVAVVACEVTGREALVERLAPDEAEALLARVVDVVESVTAHHGGVVNHATAGAFELLFGARVAREDDAVRAARAALELHARVADIASTLAGRLAKELRLRSGVHVGPAVVMQARDERGMRVTGAPAEMARRLAAAAAPDVILVSPEARRVVAPFVFTAESRPVPMQGDDPPLVPHRVLGASDVRSRLEGVARNALTPFVGRERERAALGEHMAAALAGDGGLVTLVGEAGAGKSRLLHELREDAIAAGMRVFLGRCDADGAGTPFLPFVEAVHQALGLPRGGTPQERHEDVVAAVRSIDDSLEEFLPLLLALLAIPSETHPVPEPLRGEPFQAAMLDAIAALFTVGAASAPAMLLLEDWHWADEASRAALRQLAEIASGFPLLLTVTARPEGSAELAGAIHHTLIHLPPLDGAATEAIARTVLGAARVAPDLAAHLHERTGGNPFFLEELCEALREEGAVAVRSGEAVAEGSGALHVPETVQGVLRTRIDRLDDDARDALRMASVIGREFARGVLEAVADAGGSLARSLERLKASGLVQQVGVVPEPVYRFKHALTQEVAYDSLLEHQRASLHAAVGRAIESRYAAHLDEHVERLAHHFARAEAWPDAVRYGLQAADRAIALSQTADALRTLERTEEWVRQLPDDATSRDLQADVLLRQERVCETMGLRNRQLELVEALIALLAPHGPSARLAQAYLRQGDAYTLRRRFEAAERALGTALRVAGELGDAAVERGALRSIAFLRSHEGRHVEALSTIERVLDLAREAGDARAEAGDLATMANVLRAMGRHERALEVVKAALERTSVTANPVRYGALLNVIGTVYRELGDHENALAYFRRTSEFLTHPIYSSFTLPAIAHLHLQQGHVEEALETYREAVAMNRRARYADGTALTCRSLGEVLLALERHTEAVPYLREAADLFAQLEDQAGEALMRRHLAAAHERLSEPGSARAAWERVRELLRGGDPAGEAEAVEGIARAGRRLGEAPDAVLAHYQEALALAVRAGEARRELALRNALGILHWERGAYAEAVRHYEAALRLCRALHDRAHEALMLNSLGATLHRLRRWDEARSTLLDGVHAAEETGERLLQAHALATLGEVCLAAGRLGEARASVERSLALRRELTDRRGEGWMLERLARVHAALGARDEARAAAAGASAVAAEIGDARLLDAAALLHAPADGADSLEP